MYQVVGDRTVRVDGSFKNIFAGVTTLDDKLQDGTYAQEVINMICDPVHGLITRPGGEHIGDISVGGVLGYRLTNVYMDFHLGEEKFWALLVPTDGTGDPGDTWIMDIYVYDEFGALQPRDSTLKTRYFAGILGARDISYTTVDENVYIVNRTATVTLSSLEEVRNTSSMLIVKQAPLPYSNIEVTFVASDDNTYTAEIEILEEDTDRGTNTVAEAIASAIRTVITDASVPDSIFVHGSVLLYEREDKAFAQLTSTDGSGNSVVATLNDTTPDVTNLGKYAGADCVVQIKPDPTSDRGSYYMRAVPYILTETDYSFATSPYNSIEEQLSFTTLTVGASDWNAPSGGAFLYLRGFLPPPQDIGSVTPATWNGEQIIGIYQSLSQGVPEENVIFLFVVYGAWTQEDLDWIYIVNTTTGAPHSSTPMQWVGVNTDNNGNEYTAWTGNGGDLWQDGQTFDLFDEYRDDVYGKLPEVIWEECADPEALNYLQGETLPHVLGRKADGVFTWGQMSSQLGLTGVYDIRPRKAGNDETNPLPHFVNSTIEDVGIFQNRFGSLSGDSVTLSVTNKHNGWFRETVTQVLDTDPIGLKSNQQNARTFNYMVTHNDDALIFSENAQYKLDGSIGMTPSNAALRKTTSYVSSPTCKPVSSGTDVYFPIKYSETFSGLSKYSVDTDTDSQDKALQLTTLVTEFIEGDIAEIAASTTFNLIAVRTRDVVIGTTLYVLKYIPRSKQPLVAWKKWVFPETTTILRIVFDRDYLDMIIRNPITPDNFGNTGVSILRFNINSSNTLGQQDKLYMDYQRTMALIDTTVPTASIWYPADTENMILVEGLGAPSPGRIIEGWTYDPETTFITLPYSLEGGAVTFGITYTSVYTPPTKWVRDDSGNIQHGSKLRITEYGFYAKTSEVRVTLNTRDAWPDQVYLGNNGESQYYRVPFKQRSNNSNITISCSDMYGIQITNLEWKGTYHKSGRRI